MTSFSLSRFLVQKLACLSLTSKVIYRYSISGERKINVLWPRILLCTEGSWFFFSIRIKLWYFRKTAKYYIGKVYPVKIHLTRAA